jgi:hypothetical protein
VESIKFMPTIIRDLPRVDVVLCPRYRLNGEARNWEHWGELATALRLEGFCIGVAGTQGSSFPLLADAYAWRHWLGATAGTVDLLAHCGLYVGGDSGCSHLAALMDTPSIIFRQGADNSPDRTGSMEAATRGYFHRLSDDFWGKPQQVVEKVLSIARYRLKRSVLDVHLVGS